MEIVKPCSRCKVTTTDQITGSIGKEPLRTLLQFRSGKVLGWGNLLGSNDCFFGWNALVKEIGLVHVGDRGEVVSGSNEKLTT